MIDFFGSIWDEFVWFFVHTIPEYLLAIVVFSVVVGAGLGLTLFVVSHSRFAHATPLPERTLEWCQVEAADDVTVLLRPSDCSTWVLVCPTTPRSCYWDRIEMGEEE